jgi:hypothetical protein
MNELIMKVLDAVGEQGRVNLATNRKRAGITTKQYRRLMYRVKVHLERRKAEREQGEAILDVRPAPVQRERPQV